MLIFQWIHSLCVTSGIRLHALSKKNAFVFFFYPVLRLCVHPQSETLCISSCLFKVHLLKTLSVLIGQLMPASTTVSLVSAVCLILTGQI